MSCASSCVTKEHKSYGECLRSKNLAACGLESTKPSFGMSHQKAFDKNLDLYENTIKQGIQPDTTSTKDIHKALDASDQFNKPYRGDM